MKQLNALYNAGEALKHDKQRAEQRGGTPAVNVY